MSHLLDSIFTITSIFHKHATEDGDSFYLSRRKMKEFIQMEFADVITVSAAARGRAWGQDWSARTANSPCGEGMILMTVG